MLGWIWHEEYWFPEMLSGEKFNWSVFDNQPGSGQHFPHIQDLHYAFFIGIGLLLFRLVYERLVVEPLGYMCGVSRKSRKLPETNVTLEMAYRQRKMQDSHIQTLSKQTDMSVRQIQVWMRKRKMFDVSTPMQKFKDCSWHLIFYGLATVYGIWTLWDKPWFWETKNCWIEWPKQPISDDVYWYYMLELGFYWGLVFTLFTDHKRKDFTEMIVHHVATMVLMYFSWMLNFVRVGTLVLLVHDVSDPFLALAKMCKYMNKNRATEIFFGLFIVVWYVTRIGIYPFVILYCSTMEPYLLIKRTFFGHQFFNGFLYLLLVLHIMWTYSITKILVIKFTNGKLDDVRSDSDEDESHSVQDQSVTNGVNSHNHVTRNGTNA